MRSPLTTVTLVGLLLGVPAWAQRPKRVATTEGAGPVSVTRGATLRITLAMGPAGAFDYVSDSAKLVLWFPDQAIFEPQIGGKYHFRWKKAEGLWSGVVTEFIRGNTLAFTWQPPDDSHETSVRIKLLPQGAETLLELTHNGFTSAASLDKNIEAWRFYLQNLKSVIETSTDLRKKSPHRSTTPTPAPLRRRAA